MTLELIGHGRRILDLSSVRKSRVEKGLAITSGRPLHSATRTRKLSDRQMFCDRDITSSYRGGGASSTIHPFSTVSASWIDHSSTNGTVGRIAVAFMVGPKREDLLAGPPKEVSGVLGLLTMIEEILGRDLSSLKKIRDLGNNPRVQSWSPFHGRLKALCDGRVPRAGPNRPDPLACGIRPGDRKFGIGLPLPLPPEPHDVITQVFYPQGYVDPRGGRWKVPRCQGGDNHDVMVPRNTLEALAHRRKILLRPWLGILSAHSAHIVDEHGAELLVFSEEFLQLSQRHPLCLVEDTPRVQEIGGSFPHGRVGVGVDLVLGEKGIRGARNRGDQSCDHLLELDSDGHDKRRSRDGSRR
jgi:hypothetical protein